jgi:hypothetical protein
MSSQLISNMTNQDLKFESLLYLASILQACQRPQIRGQAEAFMATRPTSNNTKHDLEFEWLLCLASALQACQHPQALEVGVHCDSGDFRITNTEKLLGRDSPKGRIHWRSPSAILRFSLATLRRTIHSDKTSCAVGAPPRMKIEFSGLVRGDGSVCGTSNAGWRLLGGRESACGHRSRR